MGRRSFFKKAGMAAAGASALGLATAEDAEATLGNVNTSSKPSDLRITDLRVAQLVGAPMRVPLIRIDTNQGITGWGEVRDGGFVALEHHSLDVPWWNSLVTPEPEVVNGFAVVPDRPGLGVDANPEVVKEHIEGEYFAPTPEWDDERSWDRLWS